MQVMDENEWNCIVISSYGLCTYSIIVSFPPTFVTYGGRGGSHLHYFHEAVNKCTNFQVSSDVKIVRSDMTSFIESLNSVNNC